MWRNHRPVLQRGRTSFTNLGVKYRRGQFSTRTNVNQGVRKIECITQMPKPLVSDPKKGGQDEKQHQVEVTIIQKRRCDHSPGGGRARPLRSDSSAGSDYGKLRLLETGRKEQVPRNGQKSGEPRYRHLVRCQVHPQRWRGSANKQILHCWSVACGSDIAQSVLGSLWNRVDLLSHVRRLYEHNPRE